MTHLPVLQLLGQLHPMPFCVPQLFGQVLNQLLVVSDVFFDFVLHHLLTLLELLPVLILDVLQVYLALVPLLYQ